MAECIINHVRCQSVFDVKAFGAVGDGKTDNTNAFLNAWKEACRSGGTVSTVDGTYLVNTIQFAGPCNGVVSFTVNAVIQAPRGQSNAHYWISFYDINGLTIQGNGTFDGQGPSAWPFNDCRHAASCSPLSPSLVLNKVNQSLVQNITLLNSKGVQMKIEESENITINNITITAPADSPNTDGIHTGNINYVNILDSNIGTGDDCISIGPGTTNINITRVNCGPGHGISIGSIGKNPSDQNVEGVNVQNCKMSSTQNGVRIKTWNSTYQVSVADVTFQDITMDKAQNPIIIDQQYCGGGHDCTGSSHVQVKDVKFVRVEGTSSSQIAVNLNCSSSNPCYGIELNDINLSLEDGGKATSSCSNANISFIGPQNPAPCQNTLSLV
ncbi:Exopolygalacturonase [Heracleum sosnowskyi]|uniref:Exopolygalacturonase n=1 Tax=Heracleum sosnowskyi TaxID=360622 RepID=A0AAD8MC59_9APIA|nr:Exopolygalacturonase [Heracleum sosnowskyi]